MVGETGDIVGGEGGRCCPVGFLWDAGNPWDMGDCRG